MTGPTGSVERPDPLREPIVISRARLHGPVTARSVLQWRRAHTLSSELLQLIGFVPVTDGSATVLVLPAHLPGHEQRLKAATAAATLRAIGHPVRLARQLEDPQAVPQLSQPLLGSALRQQLGQGGDLGRPWGDGHSDDVARTLLELSAPSSGILAVAAETLREAEWWWGAEHPVDHMPATQRLAELAEQLHAVAGEISRLRADLALMDRRRDESGQTPPHRNPSVAATAAAARRPPAPAASGTDTPAPLPHPSPAERGKPLRLSRTRGAVVAATIAAVTAIGIVPASADVPQRGVSGCFAYSWSPGWWTTTVYWHNRCSTRHRIEIVWDGQSYDPTVRLVNGNAKGNAWTTSGGVSGVYDDGRG